jgi:hypothetical protein
MGHPEVKWSTVSSCCLHNLLLLLLLLWHPLTGHKYILIAIFGNGLSNSLSLNHSPLQQRETAESAVCPVPSDSVTVFSQHVFLRYAKYFIHAAYL